MSDNNKDNNTSDDVVLTPNEDTGMGGGPCDASRDVNATSIESDPNSPFEKDICYGVESPSQRIYPTGDSAERQPLTDEGNVSLQSIYDRRKEKGLYSELDPQTSPIDSVPLPEHPFMTRLLRPLVNPGMFMKLVCLTSILWAGLLVTVPLFHRSAQREFKEGEQPGVSVDVDMKNAAGVIRRTQVTAAELTSQLSSTEKLFLGKKGKIVFGAWRRYGYIFLFAFVPWVFCAVPFFLQITEQTSDGDDKISQWPELSPLPMIGRFGWFLLLILAAGVPGYLIFGLVGLARLGVVVSLFLLFPIFYLSTADTDSFFCLLSKNILRGLRLVPRAWRDWYFFSLGTIVTVFILLFLGVGDGVFQIRGTVHSVFLTLLCSVLIMFASFLYFRMMGRLAWVLRDHLRIDVVQNEEGED